jgi:CHAT domain-containing protein
LRSALLRARLEKVRQEHEAFRNKLYVVHPDLKTRRGVTETLTIDQVGSMLADPRDAVLEYVVEEDKTLLFVITKGSTTDKAPRIDVFPIGATRRELVDFVGPFRQRLANPNISEVNASKRLYDLLLRPARELIGTKTKLVIVPDGILWDLPFQALKQPNGKYLIEDYAVLYAPSLSVLREMSSRSAKADALGLLPETTLAKESKDESSDALLALGNPALSERTVKVANSVHRDEKLLPLPDAETEVKSIARFYDAVRSRVYVGSEASEQVAKAEMSNYRTLHFATHGLLDDSNPMYSHIVLGRTEVDKDEDGLLEAWEIMDLSLNADIVVLSACDTARGQIGAGEGVVGMSWAFFAAGCPTTVVSQWKVDSASTAQLMIEFHRQLVSRAPVQRPNRNKPDALRKAMLTLMKNPRFKDPYYWAGFVVVGAG